MPSSKPPASARRSAALLPQPNAGPPDAALRVFPTWSDRMRALRAPPEAHFASRPLPGDPDWYVFALIAMQRAATANLQARMARVQLGQDYPMGRK